MATTNKDLTGVRSKILHQYDTVAVPFQYDAATGLYTQVRPSVQAFTAGVDEAGSDAGYSVNKDQSMTTLRKGGYFTEESYFAITHLGAAIKGLPRRVTPVGAGSSMLVPTDGTLAQDAFSIQAALFDSFSKFTDVEISEDGETCSWYLGTPQGIPGGFGAYGFAPNSPATNGLPSSNQLVQLKRPYLVQPGNKASAANAQVVFQTYSFNAVPRDPNFAAPADNSVIVIDVQVYVCGFACDENGQPADATEAAIAGIAA